MQFAEEGAQLGALEHLRQQAVQGARPFGGDDAVLSQKATHLIHQRVQVLEQLRASAVHFLGFLFNQRLNRDEAHRAARGGFADGLGIVAIIFVALDEGFDELRTDEPRRMAQPRHFAGPMMGAAAGLQPPSPPRSAADCR
jgi:hypothetical protein